ELPEDLRLIYRTAWELPMAALIDMAADRGAFIDQSQSLNLFMESPNIGQLSSMYFYAWKKGLKTTYYLRSRPATRITQTTVAYEEQPAHSTPQTVGATLAVARGEGRESGSVSSLSPGERVGVRADATLSEVVASPPEGAARHASPLRPSSGTEDAKGQTQ